MLPAGNHEISCADMRRQSGCWLRADSVGEALQQEPGRQGDVPLARQRCPARWGLGVHARFTEE